MNWLDWDEIIMKLPRPRRAWWSVQRTWWPPRWWPWRPKPPRPGPGPRPGPPPGPTPLPGPTPPAPDDVVHQLLVLHNGLRQQAGLGPLQLHEQLLASARQEADDCAAHQRLNHTSSDGRTPFQRMTDAGYRFTWAGENIAMGQADALAVCQAWESDPPHRENILNVHFHDVGFAVAYDAQGRPYWVADFGSTMMQEHPENLQKGFETFFNKTCVHGYRPSPVHSEVSS